ALRGIASVRPHLGEGLIRRCHWKGRQDAGLEGLLVPDEWRRHSDCKNPDLAFDHRRNGGFAG
ncbi:hypothetical protein RWU37_03030, partial [Enterococcus sp. 2CBP]|uniref:hypothetical protein n=1 Tax=Enterococcus sp. 2CBP TaxID=2800793 RepID=UPI0028FDAFEC